MFSIHDDSRDKEFELEISWICKESGGKHQHVPAELVLEAERAAKVVHALMCRSTPFTFIFDAH